MYWWNKKTTIHSISLMLLTENGIYIDNVLVEQKDNNPFYRSYVTDRKWHLYRKCTGGTKRQQSILSLLCY